MSCVARVKPSRRLLSDTHRAPGARKPSEWRECCTRQARALARAWKIEIGLHYERNNWTSDLPGDLRNGAHETVAQGDLIVTHRLSRVATLAAGVQRQQRKESFEENPVTGTNFWLGAEMWFRPTVPIVRA